MAYSKFCVICQGQSADEFVKGWADGFFNLSQPWIFMSFSDLDNVQIVAVVDRRILCELNTMPNSYLLPAGHFCVASYPLYVQHCVQEKPAPVLHFLEEFFLGILHQKTKTTKIHAHCA